MAKKAEKQMSFSWLFGMMPLILVSSFAVRAFYPEQLGFFLQIIVPTIFVLLAVFWFLKSNIFNALVSLIMTAVLISTANPGLSFIFGIIAIFLLIGALVYSLYFLEKSKED